MMTWLPWFTNRMESATTIEAFGKEIKVLCTGRAQQALSQRPDALVAELELSFGCVARKLVRFHGSAEAWDVIPVNERLGLVITTVVPNACGTPDAAPAMNSARQFLPKWVKIDFRKGAWFGEYGL